MHGIVIWGAGAIGGTIGAYLARAGVNPLMVDADAAHVAAMSAHGLKIAGPIEEFTLLHPANQKIELREGSYPVAELAAAGEAFVSSSIQEVMPVVSLDGHPIGTGRPGATAKALQDALRLRSGR